MKRDLQLKKDERLCDWCDRIADHIMAHDLDRKTLHVLNNKEDYAKK